MNGFRCDLDWKSQLRWIPEPRYSDAPFPHIKDIKFPNERKLMRSFPRESGFDQQSICSSINKQISSGSCT